MMWVAALLLLWAVAPDRCYGKCRRDHKQYIEAYGTIYCDAQKTETPTDGTVVLMESDDYFNDVAEKWGPKSETARLQGSGGRFGVSGMVTDGPFNDFVEPYLYVSGTCYFDGKPRQINEIYGIPCEYDCETIHVYRDIEFVLDGTNDQEICGM